MAKNWWFRLEWNDWLQDERLGICSFETQGFWMRCVCIMHRSDQYELTGTIDDLRRLLGCLPEEVTRCASELKRTGAADVRFGNGDVSIKSRRLERDHKARELNRLYVAKHREKDECKDDVRTHSKSKSKSKEIREEVREEKDIAKRDIPETKIILPLDFRPTYEMWEWARVNCPTLDLETELEEFITYWRDIATKNHKRTMRGWRATWKGRMKEREEKERRNGTYSKHQNSASRNDERIDERRQLVGALLAEHNSEQGLPS